MQKRFQTSLLNQEKLTTIWFLLLFYTIYIAYDITYYYILPDFPWGEQGQLREGLNYWIYIIIFVLLPIAIYYMKNENPWIIKYIYFITFTSVNIINDIWIYWGSNAAYTNGNLVEIVIVLFSPIFVNKKFFYLVSLGTMMKYVIIGLVLQEFLVMYPLVLVLVLALIAYILLHRFLDYVAAVENSYDKQLGGIVKGIIATLELKDPYTRGHSERVAQYAMILAKATGDFKDDELTSFYYVCLLHDIGKINIPDYILTKPGKLTDEEFALIKTHPVVGAEAIKQVEGISENIDVIRHHHERWDGTGYPDKLKAEDTPLLARVTAIADAFDAMTTSRSYRAALSLEEAYKRIIDGEGTQFDPCLVESFRKVYPSWVSYHKNYYNAENKHMNADN